MGKYTVEVRKMGFKILDMIGEGLGLSEGYFVEVIQEQFMAINHYPLLIYMVIYQYTLAMPLPI